jgi:hypothetical protein
MGMPTILAACWYVIPQQSRLLKKYVTGNTDWILENDRVCNIRLIILNSLLLGTTGNGAPLQSVGLRSF